MKITRILGVLFILTLLGTAPIMVLHPVQAAEQRVDSQTDLRTVELLNAPNDKIVEQSSVDVSDISSASMTTRSSLANWHTECVDCPKQFGDMTDRSLRLDTDDHPHIAYGSDHLYYAWHDGTDWHYETVDNAPNVGKFASLALDGAGRPHISYHAGYPNYDLRYAWHDGTDWYIETVDSEGSVGWDTSLALDQSGLPHISYCLIDLYEGCSDLKYAWNDGTGWQAEAVDSEGYVGGFTSLALDGADHPHVSYSDRSNGTLKYAWHDGTEWQTETVNGEWEGGSDTSLALDGLGRPHISYNGQGLALKYTWRDETGWHIETVDSEGDTGYDTSLVLDGSGQPHISYYRTDYNDQGLHYAWYDGTTWHIETVDYYGNVGSLTSLALDKSGHPHISYYYWSYYDLKYAWHDGETWQIEVVDSEGWAGQYTSLALDKLERPHISYCLFDVHNSVCDDLKYAWHDGIIWHVETVDSKGRIGEGASLALDKSDHPHISYYDDTNDNLKYAWHDGTDWHIEIVDDNGFPSTNISLALDGSDHPHISYFELYNDEGNYVSRLKYAWRDGVGWHTETVDRHGGPHTSLAMDRAGLPHISYIDSGLKYAWHDGWDWQIETVNNNIDTVQDPSLVLDEADHPYISYHDYSNNNLKYAWHDGEAWHIVTLDGAGRHSSLALDRLGRPRISYYASYPNFDLRYAWYDGTTWYTETVDSEGAVGEYTSLALDGVGQPHISYYDGTNGDLKYAWLMPPPLLLNKRVTPSDNVRNDDTLTYTLTISGPGLSVHLWDPLPPPVRYVSGSITNTIAPLAVYSPTAHVVTWQGTLPTDTVQVIRFRVTAGFTGTAGSLVLPIVNTAWLTDTYGRNVSATAIVNGWRVYLPLLLRQSP